MRSFPALRQWRLPIYMLVRSRNLKNYVQSVNNYVLIPMKGGHSRMRQHANVQERIQKQMIFGLVLQ